MRLVPIAALLLFSSVAHASGVLPPATSTPTRLDVDAAIATNASGSTRWVRIAVEGSGPLLWLVPMRPGATFELASDTWLETLDRITRPTIREPHGRTEEAPAWTRSATPVAFVTMDLVTSEAVLRERAATRGFRIAEDVAPRIAALYAEGWVLGTFELAAGASPTVRVRDSATVPELPFALFGGATTDARLTVFTFTEGAGTIGGARAIAPSSVAIGTESSYANVLQRTLRGGGWVREASSHLVIAKHCPAIESAFSGAPCGSEDLGFAVGGVRNAFVTRFAGLVPAGGRGDDIPLEASFPLEPTMWIAADPRATNAPLTPPATASATPPARGGYVATPAPLVVTGGDDCSGGGSYSDDEYEDDSCTSDTSDTSDEAAAGACDAASGSDDSDDPDDSDEEEEEEVDEEEYEDDTSDDSDWNEATPSKSRARADGCAIARQPSRGARTTLGMRRASNPTSRVLIAIAVAAFLFRRRARVLRSA